MKPTDRLNGGTIRLYNADCMEVLRSMKDKSFALAVVDPPYFTDAARRRFSGGRNCRTSGVKRNNYPRIGHWAIPDADYFREIVRVSRHQIVWGFNYFTEAAAQAGFAPGGRIVWDKVNTKSTFSDCELAANTKITGVRKFTFMWNGMLQGSEADGSVQEGDKRRNEKRIHPTQKPVQLYRWTFANYAKRGDRILDTHLGSGSSAIAAHEAGLRFTGIEIDPEFYRLAHERIAGHTAQTLIQFAEPLTPRIQAPALVQPEIL